MCVFSNFCPDTASNYQVPQTVSNSESSDREPDTFTSCATLTCHQNRYKQYKYSPRVVDVLVCGYQIDNVTHLFVTTDMMLNIL